jgi:hypothetical protein
MFRHKIRLLSNYRSGSRFLGLNFFLFIDLTTSLIFQGVKIYSAYNFNSGQCPFFLALFWSRSSFWLRFIGWGRNERSCIFD